MHADERMNIFLTGEINAGKSRLIDAFLKEYSGSVGGYKTVREKTSLDEFFGIYLLDIRDLDAPLTIDNRVGTCFPDRTLGCHSDVLEKAGIYALTFDVVPSLIVMDEIGVLEKNCTAFKNKISECLDSDTNVLGVIKKKRSRFLDTISARPDVTTLEVAGISREQLLHTLKCYLSV